MQDIEKLLLTAIGIERYGQEYYRRFAALVVNEDGKAMLNGLGKDEKEHERVLSKEYEKRLSKNVPERVESEDAVANLAIDEVFGDIRGPEVDIEDLLKILEIGVRIEDNSISYYSKRACETTEEDFKKLLTELVEMEKDHKNLLEETLFHLRQDGSWWGYVPILEG